MPPNDKVKRRRKRKIEMIDSTSNNLSAPLPVDEPPLKVVPHPVKYTSVAESGPTDLEVIFKFICLLIFYCRGFIR